MYPSKLAQTGAFLLPAMEAASGLRLRLASLRGGRHLGGRGQVLKPAVLRAWEAGDSLR